jgi:hypothetical protein
VARWALSYASKLLRLWKRPPSRFRAYACSAEQSADDDIFALWNQAPAFEAKNPNVSAAPKSFPAVRRRRDRARPVAGLVHRRPNKRNRDIASEGRALKARGQPQTNETAAESPRRPFLSFVALFKHPRRRTTPTLLPVMRATMSGTRGLRPGILVAGWPLGFTPPGWRTSRAGILARGCDSARRR